MKEKEKLQDKTIHLEVPNLLLLCEHSADACHDEKDNNHI